MNEQKIRPVSNVEDIRLRPAMYVGTTALFGLVNYLVCPVASLLARGANHIDIEVTDRIKVASDIPLLLSEHEGRIVPLQGSTDVTDLDLIILNALSAELVVATNIGDGSKSFRFERGMRTSSEAHDRCDSIGTMLWFRPDTEIFTTIDLSTAAFESYLRRLSFLYAGKHFSLTVAGTTQRFFEQDGIGSLFRQISSPFQLMHEPIRIAGQDGLLKLQLIMAHQSWSHDHVWCFINNGRAVEGGTHEEGLIEGIKKLQRELDVSNTFNNGMVAVAFLRYPNVVWKGCIKSKIGNPELHPMVANLVINESRRWIDQHRHVGNQIRALQTFQFPAIWQASTSS